MADRYFVTTAPRVRAYLDAIDELSDAGREAVVGGYTEELGRRADDFLGAHALGPESLHLRYDYVHPDGQTLFEFDFIVNGTEMASGVVQVEYVEHRTYPLD